MLKKAKQDLENALQIDSSWNIELLENVTSETFMKYQDARSKKKLSSMRDDMTKSYYAKATEIMEKKLK
jgi:hypothetical protein